jgi:hypothetical protein
MPKRKDIIGLFVVKNHVTREEAEKEPKFQVNLQTKSPIVIGGVAVTAKISFISMDIVLFDALPIASERSLKFSDEQQTLMKAKTDEELAQESQDIKEHEEEEGSTGTDED